MRKLMEARRKVDLPRYYCSTSTHATSNETKHYVPRIVRTLTSVGNPLAPHQENGVEEESDSDESWDTSMVNDDGETTRHVFFPSLGSRSRLALPLDRRPSRAALPAQT